MGSVVLDSEAVDFQGPAPNDASVVWSLIEGHLAQNGRIIDRFLVNGEPWDPESGDGFKDYQSIEVHSLTQEENVARVVDGILKSQEALINRWRSASLDSLTRPWGDFKKSAIDVLGESQPLAQSLGLLAAYFGQSGAAWGKRLADAEAALHGSLNEVMDAFEAENCIGYSDASANRVVPGLNRVFSILSEVSQSEDSNERS